MNKFYSRVIKVSAVVKKNIFVTPLKAFLILAFFPIYLFFYILKPLKIIKIVKSGRFKRLTSIQLKSILLKAVFLLFFEAILLPIWVGGYVLTGVLTKEFLGYNPQLINISGTGSMYPTFPKGEGKDPKELSKQIVDTPGMMKYPNGIVIGNKRFFNYEIGRGDIVALENDKIHEMTTSMFGKPSGWVKRVIGMAGDTIELREGIVYLNGQPLKEPYTARPRSTFGEAFLNECKRITVPANSVFVMGDNRKGSGDSREIGFMNLNDIKLVYPFKQQTGLLDKKWRDTSKDFDSISKITLNKEQYVKLLNEKRKEAGAKELTYQPKLEISAKKRGEIIQQGEEKFPGGLCDKK